MTGYTFNTILVNPPFVPSPQNQLLYRDGGATGEEILKQIIGDSVHYLAPEGRLFIVSDLVNVPNYEAKLAQWWTGGPAHQLVFCTADRDDAQFSIPHCHAPFGQSFQEYNSTLEQWLHNFHTTGIQTVNFGYILIQRLSPQQTGSYYLRTIHNPTRPIHQQVQNYFRQREQLKNAENDNWFLLLSDEIKFRVEQNFVGRKLKIELFSPQNPYFTTYQISESVYHLLESINQLKPEWQLFMTPKNREMLFDLIYKGILYLSPVRSTGGKSVRMEELPAIENNIGIIELRTKTTPTCLSAYLSG